MERLLINCDLGENESTEQTRALLACINAANICCGAHAGSREKTIETIRLARKAGVQIGAHPGLASEGGRGSEPPSVEAFDALLEAQLSFFCTAAEEAGAAVEHVKLHGLLYHAVEKDISLGNAYIKRILSLDTELQVFCLAGGSFFNRAKDAGIHAVGEIFADRSYADDGGLVPRGQVDAVIEDVSVVTNRVQKYVQLGTLDSINGVPLELDGGTLCVHGDSRGVVSMLERIGRVIR